MKVTRPRLIVFVSAMLILAAACLYLFADPSVDWSRIEERLPHCCDKNPDFQVIEAGMAEHTVTDVPAWVRYHPMRLYYRRTLVVVAGFPNCSQYYDFRKGADRIRCTVHYIDGRACVLVLSYPLHARNEADEMRRLLRTEFGKLPVKVVENGT